jgi:malto-oligosyltrehalose trehalohydrolase
MPFGAALAADGQVRFRLWAPAQERIAVAIEGGPTLDLVRDAAGWHELVTGAARVGGRYSFLLADGLKIPDPASRWQPEDCHGPSEIVDPSAYAWADRAWTGRPWHEAVLYELHVGAFTPEGTFSAAAGKLDDLVRLGVTAIEIMPVADFSGRRNWGYDGVLPFAPDSAYGRPEDLKALVDAAHGRGLMVLLDVVYNHFGPDGNYLGHLDPSYVTERNATPWGPGLNFDAGESPFLREFFIHNALYWIEEFHLDGLRLDAVHAIRDSSQEPFVVELARRVRAAGGGRHIHLVAENEENEAAPLGRTPAGQPEILTAQWNDDLHHVLHTALTGEQTGYYHEYLGDTEKLGRALAEGFVFQGQTMAYRGSPRGEPSAHLPPTVFVSFLQNHDQTGNRAFGERISVLAPVAAVRAAAAVYLLAPQIPMLFMGEEWGTRRPFPFFCNFAGELAEAVREGRRREFARFPAFRDPASRARIPDPTAESTFLSAKLDWEARGASPHAEWLDWYRRLLDLRHREIVPRLKDMGGWSGRVVKLGPLAVQASWTLGDGAELTARINLKGEAQRCPAAPAGHPIWLEGRVAEGEHGPWSVAWYLRPA